MKKSNILILAVTAFFMFPDPAHSQNGPDPVRAGMFKLYAKTATKALVAQDAVLTLNAGEHIMSKEEVDKINNFQNQFNKYLTSFDDILTIAAEIYAIYFEVDHAVKNIKELKSFTFSCPANTLAVALSKSRSHIYSDIIDNGIQIAADVEKLLPISKDEDKNSKMTEKERIDCISRVRKSLQSMKKNAKNAAVETKEVINATEVGAADLAAGLENVEATAGVDTAEVEMPQYDNMEWLAKTDPTPYFSPEVSTNKYDAEREPKIARGLKAIAELGTKNPDIAVNPLMLLLAKWWEVKPARAEIKKAIYAAANAEGYTGEDYLQNIIGSQIENFADMQQAIERLKYAKNQYKPRRAINTAAPTKRININGQLYDVPVRAFNEAVAMSNREEAREYLMKVGTPYVPENEIETF